MRQIFSFSAIIIGLISLRVSAFSIGDAALDFTLTTTSDSSYALSHYKGQVQVLYFFGCG